MTQNEAILRLLRSRPEGLTAWEATHDPEIRCMRLAARIHELREAGEPIISEKRHLHGKSWAVYRLDIPETEQRALWGDR